MKPVFIAFKFPSFLVLLGNFRYTYSGVTKNCNLCLLKLADKGRKWHFSTVCTIGNQVQFFCISKRMQQPVYNAGKMWFQILEKLWNQTLFVVAVNFRPFFHCRYITSSNCLGKWSFFGGILDCYKWKKTVQQSTPKQKFYIKAYVALNKLFTMMAFQHWKQFPLIPLRLVQKNLKKYFIVNGYNKCCYNYLKHDGTHVNKEH